MLQRFALIIPLVATSPVFSQSPAAFIEEVQVRGNVRISTEAIKYRMQTKAGDRLNQTVISRDVKSLYEWGHFESIRVEEEAGSRGAIVVFHIQERPVIRSVKYEGLKSVTNSEIFEILRERKVALSPNSTYDPARVRRTAGVIKQYLAERAHQNASVDVHTAQVGARDVALTFTVSEGPETKIEEIVIEGNNALSDREVKSAMKLVKETGPLTLFTRNNTYDELKLSSDLSRIRMAYASRGYLRSNVQEPSLQVKPKTVYRTLPFLKPEFPWGVPIPFWKKQEQRVTLTLKVEENAQYRIGSIIIAGNKQLSTDAIRFALGLVPGSIYDESRFRQGIENIRRLYGARGYITFTPVPAHNLDDEKKIVNIVLNIDEGRQFYVNRISFSGNYTTRDRVIRRELAIEEGEVFNSDAWNRSLMKLNQLGYFEPVREEDAEVKLDPASDAVDILLKVKERDGNRIGFSGGLGSASGGFLGINYSTNNFLGLGETIAVDLEHGSRQSQYRFGLTEPYLFGRPVTAGVSLFSTKFQYDQSGLKLNEKRSGFSAFSSYPVGLFQRLGLTYQLENTKAFSLDSATQEFFSTLATGDQKSSNYFTRRLISSYVFNSVDNPNDSKRGFSASAFLESAGGLLGGNVNFFRPSFELKAFRPMNGGRNTLAMRFAASHVRSFGGRSVPFYERSYLGGEFDLRGFDYRSVSPAAWITRTVDGVVRDEIVQVGGDAQAVFNLEYRIPIAPGITFAPFVDVGNSWVLNKNALRREIKNAAGQAGSKSLNLLAGANSGLRVSTGVELQIRLPVIHLPLRLIFALNPSRMDRTYTGPETGAPFSFQEPFRGFKFSIGKTF